MDELDIFNEIKRMLVNITQRDIDMNLDTLLKLGCLESSLKVSSLEMVRWFVAVEEKYNIDITSDDKTVESIVKKIVIRKRK